MKKKICVYAIAKNEIKFIDRWYNSVKEADYVCVLDTGSTDGSVEKFKSLGIILKEKKYDNFRFDVARNDSLKLIPKDADICVCVDIDEEFEKGWTKILKDNWKDDTIQARYRYTWNFNSDGSEGIVFMADKIHKNKMFKWTHPVHEVLTPVLDLKGEIIDLPNIQLNHRADETKSRSSYLPLLELSVKEDPTDDRNMHYLGREYMFHGDYEKAIETLKRHLSLPSATWPDERSASLRYIAKCYESLNDHENQEKYLLLSLIENNKTREPYFQLGEFYFNQQRYLQSCIFFEEMLKIEKRELNYLSLPTCWGSLPYDYLSICYYELGDTKKAVKDVLTALEYSSEQRLKDNLKFMMDKINQPYVPN